MSGNCIKLYDKLYVMLATLCTQGLAQLCPYLASRHSPARPHGQQTDSRDLILTNKRDHLYIPSLIILTLHYACSFTVMNITSGDKSLKPECVLWCYLCCGRLSIQCSRHKMHARISGVISNRMCMEVCSVRVLQGRQCQCRSCRQCYWSVWCITLLNVVFRGSTSSSWYSPRWPLPMASHATCSF